MFLKDKASRFLVSQNIKVVRLSALGTGLLYPPGNIPGTHFCYTLSRPQSHTAAGRIMSMKNISAQPQPIARPSARNLIVISENVFQSSFYIMECCTFRTKLTVAKKKWQVLPPLRNYESHKN